MRDKRKNRIREMRKMRDDGKSLAEIAAKYDIDVSVVSRDLSTETEEDTTIETFTIRADNRSTDLQFEGEQIASINNRWINGRDQKRWVEYDLYATKSQKIVFVWSKISLWQGEPSHIDAEVFDSLDVFREWFLSDELGISVRNLEKEFFDELKIPLVEKI